MSPKRQLTEIKNFSTFLDKSGWDNSTLVPMRADAGLRLYFKVTKAEKSVLLMDMSNVSYDGAFDAYIKIARYLKTIGVRVPEIYNISEQQQLCLIEILGHESFGDALKSSIKKSLIYEKATDILIRLKEGATQNDLGLVSYKKSRVGVNLPQFVDYYMPAATQKPTTNQDRQDIEEVWAAIEKNLPPCPMGFCHADYHLENLMWRPESDEGYGLIDFQDAFWGFQGYDLLNLLEDARVSVPANIKEAMKDRYCDGMGTLERSIFDDWYVVLSAHFHCRVIGLFVKLYQERGMDQYLVHIPRLQGYIRENLKNPVLAPLKEFIERHNISLEKSPV